MKPCIIIPSFNGEKTIGLLVSKVNQRNIDVIVVDDGSLDLTSQRAALAGAIVLRNSNNRGKGVSLRKGFAYALGKGYEVIITMDSDGQHLPEDIDKFLQAHTNNPEVAMVIGNRMHQPLNMPFERRITNRIMSKLISWICHQRIPDSQNGFRLIKSNLLKILALKCDKFEIESEMILEAAKQGVKIVSVEIASVYENHPSLISPLVDTMRFIKFILPYVHFQKYRHKSFS